MTRPTFFVAYAPDVSTEIRQTSETHNLTFRAVCSADWGVVYQQMRTISAHRLERAKRELEAAQLHYDNVMKIEKKHVIKDTI